MAPDTAGLKSLFVHDGILAGIGVRGYRQYATMHDIWREKPGGDHAPYKGHTNTLSKTAEPSPVCCCCKLPVLRPGAAREARACPRICENLRPDPFSALPRVTHPSNTNADSMPRIARFLILKEGVSK